MTHPTDPVAAMREACATLTGGCTSRRCPPRREAPVSSVPMPRDLSEEAVARWLYATAQEAHPRKTPGFHETPWDRLIEDGRVQTRGVARAVRALVEREVAKERASTREKVREAAAHPRERVVTQSCECCSDVVEITPDEIVSRVLGEEAPRG